MTKSITENNTVNTVLGETVTFYLQRYGEQLIQVWLYGSKARGDYNESSDMDIMIVVDEDASIDKGVDTDKYNMVMSILDRYNELISVMTYTVTDFNSDAIPLHRNIKREGILFYDKFR